MAQRFSRNLFSDGNQGVLVTASMEDNNWNLIHTSTTLDEVWLYGMNTLGSAKVLNIAWCSTSTSINTGSTITVSLPGQSGIYLVVPGLTLPAGVSILCNTENAADSGGLVVYGFVNSIATV